MTSATQTRSGKAHHDENFPVASRLIRKRHRATILAFYRFARAADDVADHPSLCADRKLKLLDGLDAALDGRGPSDPEVEPLRRALQEHDLTPRHAHELLDAFRLDVRKNRYASWHELMCYCRLSAMPVGRFFLDVHREDRATWKTSDPLCVALQVINHLQDCAKDYRLLDRVYLPRDMLAAHGASIEMLDRAQSTPALLGAIGDLAHRTSQLLHDAAPLVHQVADVRLALEITAIQALAEHLVRRLETRDPLSESVHVGKAGFAILGGLGILRGLGTILMRPLATKRKFHE
jgi:hydroxysqualene synthase